MSENRNTKILQGYNVALKFKERSTKDNWASILRFQNNLFFNSVKSSIGHLCELLCLAFSR